MMGDSYREELKKKKVRSGYASPAMVFAGAKSWAEVRELYFRKSPPGHSRRLTKPAQKRLLNDCSES